MSQKKKSAGVEKSPKTPAAGKAKLKTPGNTRKSNSDGVKVKPKGNIKISIPKRDNKIYIDEAARVSIGENYKNVPFYRILLGVPIVYLPIILFPFVMLSAWITYLHLKMIGAKNVYVYRDFLPDRSSFRYNFKTQIIADKRYFFTTWSRSVVFWMFNCTRYCPYSVALFQWHSYLVKVVENFWCPFNHGKKNTYAEGAIDKSYWHQRENDAKKLHPDDRYNPIWNKDA